MILNAKNQAIAIWLNGRWFAEITKTRVKTAWSLAGAKLFMPGDYDKINPILAKLEKKGKKPLMADVHLVDMNSDELYTID